MKDFSKKEFLSAVAVFANKNPGHINYMVRVGNYDRDISRGAYLLSEGRYSDSFAVGNWYKRLTATCNFIDHLDLSGKWLIIVKTPSIVPQAESYMDSITQSPTLAKAHAIGHLSSHVLYSKPFGASPGNMAGAIKNAILETLSGEYIQFLQGKIADDLPSLLKEVAIIEDELSVEQTMAECSRDNLSPTSQAKSHDLILWKELAPMRANIEKLIAFKEQLLERYAKLPNDLDIQKQLTNILRQIIAVTEEMDLTREEIGRQLQKGGYFPVAGGVSSNYASMFPGLQRTPSPPPIVLGPGESAGAAYEKCIEEGEGGPKMG